jgi:hypothetical protein
VIEIIDSKPCSGNPAAKWCWSCGRQLETTEFDKDSSRKDGLNHRCSWCDREHQRTPEYKAYRRIYMKEYRRKKKPEGRQ